ncbi:FMN-binding protein [Escherichia coli]
MRVKKSVVRMMRMAVKKDGGDFDQFTGATITPRAVVNAVKRAGLYAQTLPAQLSHFLPVENKA